MEGIISGVISVDEVLKFLGQYLKSPLAIAIFKQLTIDAGNTAKGLSETLKERGMKSSLTRVYEELVVLTQLGLVRRVSKRPPIYTTVLSRDVLEQLALRFTIETREELMRRWAATYPFLPDSARKGTINPSSPSDIPMVNFNPYPIVDIYNTDLEGLKRYFLAVFDSPEILISNTTLDTGLSGTAFLNTFEREQFKVIHSKFEALKARYGKIKMRTLSNIISGAVVSAPKNISEENSVMNFLASFFDYEFRYPTSDISSFVLGSENVFFPIGVSGTTQTTYAMIEIRESKITKKARTLFDKVWDESKLVLKAVNGKVQVGDMNAFKSG